MKLLDIYRKGNVVDFLFGEDNLDQWGGDDWNDKPWECNAGIVYDTFISAKITGVFPTNLTLDEPRELRNGLEFSRDEFKKNKFPILVIGKADIGYIPIKENRNSIKFYMSDSMANVILKILKVGYIIPNEKIKEI